MEGSLCIALSESEYPQFARVRMRRKMSEETVLGLFCVAMDNRRHTATPLEQQL
jgi:hypothetical protein